MCLQIFLPGTAADSAASFCFNFLVNAVISSPATSISWAWCNETGTNERPEGSVRIQDQEGSPWNPSKARERIQALKRFQVGSLRHGQGLGASEVVDTWSSIFPVPEPSSYTLGTARA